MSAWARADLRDIVVWSRDRFGVAQATLYRKTIFAAITDLSENPQRPGVRRRDDIVRGLRTFHIARRGRRGRHFILFRLMEDVHAIGVVRLLHDAMDIAHHIPPS